MKQLLENAVKSREQRWGGLQLSSALPHPGLGNSCCSRGLDLGSGHAPMAVTGKRGIS